MLPELKERVSNSNCYMISGATNGPLGKLVINYSMDFFQDSPLVGVPT